MPSPELVFDVVDVEERHQCVSLGIEITGGSRCGQQHGDVAVQDGGGRSVARCRVAVGRGEQFVMVVCEAQPFGTEGDQPIQRSGVRTQRCRAEKECVLTSGFVFIEKHQHQSGPTAEASEHRAFAHASGLSDRVHRDGPGALFIHQSTRGVEDPCPVSGGVATFCGRNPVDLCWFGLGVRRAHG